MKKRIKKKGLLYLVGVIAIVWGSSSYLTNVYLKDASSNINVSIKEENFDLKDYPKELIEALSKNEDMLSFVKGYKEKKGNVYKKDIGHVQKGVFPLLLQYDEGWGYGLYGGEVLALTGCGPSVIAMAYAGLTGKNDLTPYDVAKYAEENGYFSGGTSWSMMQTGVEHFGLKSKELSLDENIMINEITRGNPIILSMRPGDFTSTGHFIIITGYENGMFKVNDPNSGKRSNKPWSYEKLSSQIKNLWAIYIA